MPVIKEYTSEAALRGPGRGIVTSGAGANAVADAGRAISQMNYQSGQLLANAAANQGRALGQLGRGLSEVGQQVQQYQEHQETLRFHASEAQFTNEMTQAWNAMRTNADPNDPTVAAKFNEEVYKPAFSKFAEDFSSNHGQEMVASYGARLSDHLFAKQAADASTAAGAAVIKNLTTISDNNAAVLVADPSALQFVNGQTAGMIENYKRANPNLSVEQQAHLDEMGTKMRRENTIAAFHGMASKNPEAATAALAGGFGHDDLSATDRATLDGYARAQANIAKEERKSAEVEQRRQEQQAANADANKLFTDHINPDTGQLEVGKDYFQGVKDYVAKHPNEETGQARSLFAVGQKAIADEQTRKFQTTDPSTYQDVQARSTLPPDDPRALSLADVDNLYVGGQLSKADHAMFRQQVADLQKDPVKRDALSQFTKFLASQKTSITRSSPATGNFPQEDQRYGQFQFDMRQQFDQALKNGNWKEVLNPNDPKFLGKQTPTYGYTTKEGLKVVQQNLRGGTGQAEPVKPAASARQPGETMEQWNKRTGL